jgi:hypothetical protein
MKKHVVEIVMFMAILFSATSSLSDRQFDTPAPLPLPCSGCPGVM